MNSADPLQIFANLNIILQNYANLTLRRQFANFYKFGFMEQKIANVCKFGISFELGDAIVLSLTNDTIKLTRRLNNVRLHMIFRPELIYIFDLIVNQMKK